MKPGGLSSFSVLFSSVDRGFLIRLLGETGAWVLASFPFLGAICSGVFYLLYGVGLLVTSGGVDTTVVLRNAGPNEPIFLLMVLFAFDESIKAAPWFRGCIFYNSWDNFVCCTWGSSRIYLGFVETIT